MLNVNKTFNHSQEARGRCGHSCPLAATLDHLPLMQHKSFKLEPKSEMSVVKQHNSVYKIQTDIQLLISPQAAQQIIELQEAAQINAGLQPANIGRNTSLHDMKTVVKTWRNRLPIVSDDLSHWSSIFMWRQHHYQGTTYHTELCLSSQKFSTSDIDIQHCMTSHTHTHIYLAQCSALSCGDFESIHRGSHCKM